MNFQSKILSLMYIKDDIITYRDMCDIENVQTLQRGMNYRLNPHYSVVLMSQRSNAPYKDKVHNDGVTIEYEGHDVTKSNSNSPKYTDQPRMLPSGKLTQNGLFVKAVDEYKAGKKPESVKIYEKINSGIWSLKGYFDLVDYLYTNDGNRKVFRFIMKLSNRPENLDDKDKVINHSRVIPSLVKQIVWKRDQGKCVLCGEKQNLHYDHDIPFSKGGTSLIAENVRLLCVKHNLEKSDKIL